MFSYQLSLPSLRLPHTKRAIPKTPFRLKSGCNHPGGVPEDVPLPRGVWWLRHTKVREEAVFGDTFVIHRPQQPSLDLVVTPSEDRTVQVWIPNTTGAGIVPIPRPGLLPPEFAEEELTIDVEILTDDVESSSKEETALVFLGTRVDAESVDQPSSPRRTSKVKFTCNRCQTRNEKFVNPHAWNHGVVFCRCEGCKVIHLIRDQKGIFSCLKGPLFTQQIDPEKLNIPEGFPQNPTMPERSDPEDDDQAVGGFEVF